MENPQLNKISDEIKQKQISGIKEIVQRTFEQLEALEKTRSSIQEEIRILKHDLFDLKDGRLDRILERQGMNENIDKISVLKISKCLNAGRPATNPWYEEYEISYEVDGIPITFKLTNSFSKAHAAGSYKLKDGSIRYL